jgi:hypothetical protein
MASSIKIFSIDNDEVVNALVATGRTTYKYAMEHLTPLIDRLEIQRRIQNPNFYGRLRRDILKRCLMPPITLAFIKKDHAMINSTTAFQRFITANISKGFVLDGIQRLSSLKRAAEDFPKEFPSDQPLFLNVLVCNSMDNLLYRMITLNNGQKPMTTRHQIEILTANLGPFGSNLSFTTERDGVRRQQGVFSQSDFVLGYLAFLSESTNIDSQKLIQEKLDDLLANKILDHDPKKDEVQFADVLAFIAKLSAKAELDRWFKVTNNLIGFCAGIRKTYVDWEKVSPTQFIALLQVFDEAFKSFDVSKIKLGKARRNAVEYMIKNPKKSIKATASELTDFLVDVLE